MCLIEKRIYHDGPDDIIEATKVAPERKEMRPLVIIGIDYGTTYSGVSWAWSSLSDHDHVINRWASSCGADTTSREITVLARSSGASQRKACGVIANVGTGTSANFVTSEWCTLGWTIMERSQISTTRLLPFWLENDTGSVKYTWQCLTREETMNMNRRASNQGSGHCYNGTPTKYVEFTHCKPRRQALSRFDSTGRGVTTRCLSIVVQVLKLVTRRLTAFIAINATTICLVTATLSTVSQGWNQTGLNGAMLDWPDRLGLHLHEKRTLKGNDAWIAADLLDGIPLLDSTIFTENSPSTGLTFIWILGGLLIQIYAAYAMCPARRHKSRAVAVTLLGSLALSLVMARNIRQTMMIEWVGINITLFLSGLVHRCHERHEPTHTSSFATISAPLVTRPGGGLTGAKTVPGRLAKHMTYDHSGGLKLKHGQCLLPSSPAGPGR